MKDLLQHLFKYILLLTLAFVNTVHASSDEEKLKSLMEAKTEISNFKILKNTYI